VPGPEAPRGLWACAGLNPDGAWAWFAVVLSARHADGLLVERPEADAWTEVADDPHWVAHLDAGVVTTLRRSPNLAPDAPPLWFIEIAESSTPPAAHLVAFSGHGVEPGTLHTSESARVTGVTSADQLGAVRWYPATGEVDQVYVDPSRRREGIAGLTILAAATLNRSRGLPRFWGDGQRTALGDRLRDASPWRHRAAELTHLAPPMTPPEEDPPVSDAEPGESRR